MRSGVQVQSRRDVRSSWGRRLPMRPRNRQSRLCARVPRLGGSSLRFGSFQLIAVVRYGASSFVRSHSFYTSTAACSRSSSIHPVAGDAVLQDWWVAGLCTNSC
ncbi:hypothetical protein TRVL_03139 [Trypanosoma vivax]|nr:hypothetical protein TRVL_03139 [Trypanosoma vivax]